jgi:predicted nucleotidyltransferase
VDLLFELEDEASLTISTWHAMDEELRAILGRKVDLVPRSDVEQSPNYIRRSRILRTAEPIYGSR